MIAAGAKPSRAQLYALLGVMLVFWSANFIFAKLAIRELPSVLVVCLRTLLAGVVMWPVYAFARDRFEPGMRVWRRQDVPMLTALGVLGVIGNQLLFIVGLSMTSVAHGSVITALAPLFVLSGAAVIGQEHFTGRKLIGMLVAAGGVGVLQIGRSHSGGATFAGDLIMVASQVVFAAFTVLSKRVAAQFGTITLNTFAFLCGALILLPFTVWDLSRIDVARVSYAAWMSVAYMALFPSIAGYLIYSYALRYLPASRVSSVSYLQPVLATLLAVFFLREQPGAAFAGGAALVLGGVYVTERR
jgi:drug/metabolite transporter (DMT)-like permease